jgi:hypothetical protein
MSRRGCSLPANASGFGPRRASVTSRFGQVERPPGLGGAQGWQVVPRGRALPGPRAGGLGLHRPRAVSRPFPSWNRSKLTEISLRHACSCQEILRAETARQAGRRAPAAAPRHLHVRPRGRGVRGHPQRRGAAPLGGEPSSIFLDRRGIGESQSKQRASERMDRFVSIVAAIRLCHTFACSPVCARRCRRWAARRLQRLRRRRRRQPSRSRISTPCLTRWLEMMHIGSPCLGLCTHGDPMIMPSSHSRRHLPVSQNG